jgi:peptide/nickel transport system permease protein
MATDAVSNPPVGRLGSAGRRATTAEWVRRAAWGLGQALVVAFAVVTVSYLLVRLVPGDPAQAILGARATPQAVEALRHEMHIDQPLLQGYVDYLGGLVRGDLGNSIVQSDQSVATIIGRTLPVTIDLIVATMILSVVVGVPLGLLAALTPRPAVDHGTRIGLVILLATPPFFLGLLLIATFSLHWSLLPAGGWAGAWPANFRYLILPAVAMSAFLMPQIARTVRQVAIDVSRQDFIEATVARGMPSWVIVGRHVLPNSLLPVITLLGLNMGALIAGAVVVEAVFGMPGIGSQLVQSVAQRDYPVIQGIAIVSALFVVFANAGADALYVVADPRTRRR